MDRSNAGSQYNKINIYSISTIMALHHPTVGQLELCFSKQMPKMQLSLPILRLCTLRGSRHSVPSSSSSSVAVSSQANSLVVGAEAANLVPMGGDAMDLPSSSVSVAAHGSDKVGAVSHLSTAAQLLDKWCDAKLLGTEMEDEITVDVFVPTRSPLEGKELLEFNASEERERRKRAEEEERIALLKEVELARGRLRLGEDDLARENATASGGVGEQASTSANKMEEDGVLPGEDKGTAPSRKKSRFDSNLFLKYSKPLFMTFTDQEEAVGIGQDPHIAKFGIGESIGYSDSVLVDDYGIAVMPEKFHDLVTGR